MPWLEDLWQRVSTRTPAPDAAILGVIGFVALACVILAWPFVRMLVTVCHEAGHAVAATLTGRSLESIRLHSDTSGLTVSRGAPNGPGMVVTLFCGYPAASMVGLAAAVTAGVGYATATLFLLVVALALMLLKIRNIHGALVVVTIGTVLGLVVCYGPEEYLGWLVHGLAWLLLLAGPRPMLELALHSLRVGSQSDAAQLARLTRVPQMGWVILWLGATLGALALGTTTMLPVLLPFAG